MNNSQVAHVWAQREKTRASGSNMYFEGDIIFSYGSHFPMAKHVDDNTALYTTGNYSVSTAKHLNHTWKAIYHKKVFCVPDVLACTKEQHKRNYQAYRASINTACDSFTRMRKGLIFSLNSINETIDQANEYTKYFKLGFRAMPHKTGWDIRADYSKALEREKEADERAGKREAERLEAYRKKNAENREKWINGEPVHFGQAWNDFSILRIKPSDKEVIETSGRAEIPVSHAIKAWPLLKKYGEAGREFNPNGHKIKVGHFTIDHISEVGIIKAGCHKFEYSEIKRMAGILGLN